MESDYSHSVVAVARVRAACVRAEAFMECLAACRTSLLDPPAHRPIGDVSWPTAPALPPHPPRPDLHPASTPLKGSRRSIERVRTPGPHKATSTPPPRPLRRAVHLQWGDVGRARYLAARSSARSPTALRACRRPRRGLRGEGRERSRVGAGLHSFSPLLRRSLVCVRPRPPSTRARREICTELSAIVGRQGRFEVAPLPGAPRREGPRARRELEASSHQGGAGTSPSARPASPERRGVPPGPLRERCTTGIRAARPRSPSNAVRPKPRVASPARAHPERGPRAAPKVLALPSSG